MSDTINYPIIDPINTVVVQRVNNGFYLTKFNEIEGENGNIIRIHQSHVVQDNDIDLYANDTDWNSVKEMLWLLLDLLEIYTSKHHKQTIRIEVEDQQ